MAKYFSNDYLRETMFQQQLEADSNTNIVQYFNVFILCVSISSLFINYNSNSEVVKTVIASIPQSSINIHMIAPLEEKDVFLFIDDMYDQLDLLNEKNALVEIKRNGERIVTDITITKIENPENVQRILNQIHHDDQVVVTSN